MDADAVFLALREHGVRYLLIGGMNFLLRHEPVLTFDIDVWIRDDQANRTRTEAALAELGVSWGATEADWGPVADRAPGWLSRQGVFCMTSPHGAIDVFRSVAGLPDWDAAAADADESSTAAGTPFLSLSDRHMLDCQLALPEAQRKLDRVRVLKRALGESEEPA